MVDDASTDQSLKRLSHAGVAVIHNEENLGPVRARNAGARTARGDYLLFLDADAVLTPGYVARLREFLEKHTDIGVASGKILTEDGERMWFNFGYDPAPLRDMMQNFFDAIAARLPKGQWRRSLLARIAHPFTLNFAPDREMKVDWVVEMAFMTHRELFEAVGGLDEHFFMFFEGPDYCRRVRTAGYGVYYLPYVICRHLGGHSHAAIRDKIFAESREYYLQKYSR